MTNMSQDQSVSQRIRGLQRLLRDLRLGAQTPAEAIKRAEGIAATCAVEVEQMEIAAGTASVGAQLRAAGTNPVMLRAVLRQASRKAVRHG